MRHRIAFSLHLPADRIELYRLRHDNLWPELKEAIRAQGGSNYSIFALPDVDRVRGYVEVEDLERWSAGGESALTRNWWRWMADVMPTNSDFSPVQAPIIEVFHLD